MLRIFSAIKLYWDSLTGTIVSGNSLPAEKFAIISYTQTTSSNEWIFRPPGDVISVKVFTGINGNYSQIIPNNINYSNELLTISLHEKQIGYVTVIYSHIVEEILIRVTPTVTPTPSITPTLIADCV